MTGRNPDTVTADAGSFDSGDLQPGAEGERDGPVGYYALGRSPIPRSVRLMLVVGGMVVYLAVAAIGFLIGAS